MSKLHRRDIPVTPMAHLTIMHNSNKQKLVGTRDLPSRVPPMPSYRPAEQDSLCWLGEASVLAKGLVDNLTHDTTNNLSWPTLKRWAANKDHKTHC